MGKEEARDRAELDQMLAENLGGLQGLEDELVGLVDGDGPIMDDDEADIARMAAATCTLLLALHDLREEELNEGFEGAF